MADMCGHSGQQDPPADARGTSDGRFHYRYIETQILESCVSMSTIYTIKLQVQISLRFPFLCRMQHSPAHHTHHDLPFSIPLLKLVFLPDHGIIETSQAIGNDTGPSYSNDSSRCRTRMRQSCSSRVKATSSFGLGQGVLPTPPGINERQESEAGASRAG